MQTQKQHSNATSSVMKSPSTQMLWNRHRLKCYEIAVISKRRSYTANQTNLQISAASVEVLRGKHRAQTTIATSMTAHGTKINSFLNLSKFQRPRPELAGYGTRRSVRRWGVGFQVRTVCETATTGASITWSSRLTVKEKSLFHSIWLLSKKRFSIKNVQ